MQIARNFAKRETAKSDWSGDIGRIVLETDAKTIKLNGKEIPLESMEYLLNFSLQAFQDAYAGATGLAEAKGLFDKKLNAVIEGTIGTRGGGGESEEIRVARQITREVLRAQVKAGKIAQEVYDAKYKEDNDAVDEVYKKNEAKLAPKVKDKLAELAAMREAKRKLAQSVDLEI